MRNGIFCTNDSNDSMLLIILIPSDFGLSLKLPSKGRERKRESFAPLNAPILIAEEMLGLNYRTFARLFVLKAALFALLISLSLILVPKIERIRLLASDLFTDKRR